MCRCCGRGRRDRQADRVLAADIHGCESRIIDVHEVFVLFVSHALVIQVRVGMCARFAREASGIVSVGFRWRTPFPFALETEAFPE